jgi:hypothetical protein
MANAQQQQQQLQPTSEVESVRRSVVHKIWLAGFVQMIAGVAVLPNSEGVQAEWRQLARPTASLLEHAMHILAQQTPDDVEYAILRTGMWQVVNVMLCSELVPAAAAGPLLTAASAEVAEQQLGGGPVAAPIAQQVVSMCVSAVKLLAFQTEGVSPLLGDELLGDELPCPKMKALERITDAASRMLRNTPQQASTDMLLLLLDVKLPWAVLLLRCLQLHLLWLQRAALQLPAAHSSAAAVDSSRAQRQQQLAQEGSTTVKAAQAQSTLMVTAAVSLSQVYLGLRVLCRHFQSWCTASNDAAAAQSAFAELPLLQCWCQLHSQHLRSCRCCSAGASCTRSCCRQCNK